MAVPEVRIGALCPLSKSGLDVSPLCHHEAMTTVIEKVIDTSVGDGSEMVTEDLADEICRQAGHLTAATCRWLLRVGDFARRAGWGDAGITSCAHWLAWRRRCFRGNSRRRDRQRDRDLAR